MNDTDYKTDRDLDFHFGTITTLIFLLVLFLLPILLLFRLIQALTVGEVGVFLSGASGATGSLKDYLILIFPTALLAVWSFLRYPELLIHRLQMEPLSLHNPELANQILDWATSVHLKKAPIILRIPGNMSDIYVFGTWRDQYLAIADRVTEIWAETDQQKAVVLHELGHIKAGDTWKATLAFEYVKWFFVMVLLEFVCGQVIPVLFGSSRVFAGFLWAATSALGQIVTGLLFVVAIRFLFRLREFGADLFSSNQGENKKSLEDAFFTHLGFGTKNITSQPLAFMSEGVRNTITEFLGFHPSTIRRLILLREPEKIIEEIIGIVGIAGLIAGEIVAWFWNAYTLPILIGGMMIIGVPSIIFIKPDSLSNTLNNELINFRYTIRAAIIFSSGVVVAWLFYMLPPSLLEFDVNDTASHLVTGGELRFGLSYSLDVLLLISIVAPFLLICFVYLANLLSKTLVKNLVSKSKVRWGNIFGWLVELPFIVSIYWTLAQWWDGNSISFNEVKLVLLFNVIWIALWAIIDQLLKNFRNSTKVNLR